MSAAGNKTRQTSGTASEDDAEEHLEALTKKQLLDLAAEVEIEGAYAMKKAELIQALQQIPVA